MDNLPNIMSVIVAEPGVSRVNKDESASRCNLHNQIVFPNKDIYKKLSVQIQGRHAPSSYLKDSRF